MITLRRSLVTALLCVILSLTTVVSARDSSYIQFYSAERGRWYTVQTFASGTALDFPGHWLYQPSVLLVNWDAGTFSRWLVFNSNLNANDASNEAICVATDAYNNLQFPQPSAVLRRTDADNICDMMDARPIFDGNMFHVYVQATLLIPGFGCSSNNYVIQATGLSLWTLQWDKEPYTQHAKVVMGGPNIDIGEGMQWFYIPGSEQPFVVTYNDWSAPEGWKLRIGSSADGSAPVTTVATDLLPGIVDLTGYGQTRSFPDILLSGSHDEATLGPPCFGAESTWLQSDTRWRYSKGIGFFASLLSAIPSDGVGIAGALQSIYWDTFGERSFRPRFARDAHGFVPPQSSSNGTNYWQTYVVYNPSQINQNYNDDGDGVYTNWHNSDQRFAFSLVLIAEQ